MFERSFHEVISLFFTELQLMSRRPCWWTRTKCFPPLGTKLFFHANFAKKMSLFCQPTWLPCHVVASQEYENKYLLSFALISFSHWWGWGWHPATYFREGALPYVKNRDGHWKIWIKLLKDTNLSQAFQFWTLKDTIFSSLIGLHHQHSMCSFSSSATLDRTLTAKKHWRCPEHP